MKICKERPILFSAPMVRAILEGRKTQTRRVVKPQPPESAEGPYEMAMAPGSGPVMNRWAFRVPDKGFIRRRCPFGTIGTRLWVRETWAHDGPDLETVRARVEDALEGGETYGPYYKATEVAPDTLYWRPSIHMPRWASRITLEVVDVRVEKLQDISEADAMAEGIQEVSPGVFDGEGPAMGTTAQIAFYRLWQSINIKTHPWASNPWVWVVEFRVVAPS